MTGPRHADRPSHTEGSPLDPDKLEVAPGTVHASVQGWVPELATEEELRIALEKAFDYRGDVTLTLKDNSKIEGYIFDRVSGATLATSFVRVLPKDSGQRVKVAYADIAAIAFSGRDSAAGKSWEAWVHKYWEKKESGEADLSLEPESLEQAIFDDSVAQPRLRIDLRLINTIAYGNNRLPARACPLLDKPFTL